MTKNQEAILNIIQSSTEHMTAEEIYMRCREKSSKMSIATIYRNLGIMVEQGMIAKISISGQPEHYDRSIVKHDHIFCKYCGKLLDVDVGDLKTYLESRIDVKLESYDLCMRFICQECQNSGRNQNNSFD